MSPQPVYFFLPRDRWPQTVPERLDGYHPGCADDIFRWITQTYVHLRQRGVACELVNQLPAAGIVIAHRDCLHPGGYLSPHPDLFWVCLQSDRPLLAYAQQQVLPNPLWAQQQPNSHYIGAWPTPVRSRCSQRGDRFETVAYVGHLNDLADELKQYRFRQQIEALGLRWQARLHDPYDYQDIDAVVAVRSFNPERLRKTRQFMHQSAQKLCDAWLAGVPAILGPESACQPLQQSPPAYLEARSVTDVLAALQQLRDRPSWRQQLIASGQRQAQAFSAIAADWQQYLSTAVWPAYRVWQSLPLAERQAQIDQQQQRVDQENRAIAAQVRRAAELRTAHLPYDLSEKL
ncbi:MAG: hypothetical protein F6J97_17585 [Leptolyngbya sp. SIO4C1]|nr:hypothetical protein [Leptolyngbya sp. SIO4C1]